jgi:hypothetical protein
VLILHARDMRPIMAALVLAVTLLSAACGRSDPDEVPYAAPSIAPLPHEKASFVVVGDFGVGNDDEKAVADAMHSWVVEHGADGFISVGDSIYPEAETKYFEKAWTEPYGWVDDAGIPVIAALGNHDVEDGSSEDVIDFFDLPGPWYEQTIKGVRFIVLNSNEVTEDQTAWLEGAITDPWKSWTVVLVHKPPYDCGKYDGTPEVRSAWVPSFEHRAALVLSGHDHNYQRFAPLDGVTYVITGGGGDSFYGLQDECSPGTPERLAGNDSMHHFLVMKISETRLQILAIGADGSILDRFSISRMSS